MKKPQTTINQHSEAHPTENVAERFPDTERLGWMQFREGDVLGFVPSVNGPGAEACPHFTATRCELEHVTRMWIKMLIDTEFFCFSTESTGTTEWREMTYAARRLGRLQQTLGEEAIDRITNEVTAELGERLKSKAWDEFLAQR